MDKLKGLRSLFEEVLRYCVAGSAGFLADAGTLALLREVVLPEMGGYRLYAAAAAGFIVGLAVNYILSVSFVFKAAKKGAGRSPGAFAVFVLIGLVGLGLTELGMYAGTSLLRLHYLLVKTAVTAIVFFWNYLARKILIFK